jgi:hypothetical protein
MSIQTQNARILYDAKNPGGVNQVQNIQSPDQLRGRFAELSAANPYKNFTYARTIWDDLGEVTGAWKTGDQKLQEQYQQLAKQYDAELLQAQSQEEAERLYNSPAAQAQREREAGLNPNLTGISSSPQSMASTQGVTSQDSPALDSVNAENTFTSVVDKMMSFINTSTSLVSGAMGFASGIQGLKIGKQQMDINDFNKATAEIGASRDAFNLAVDIMNKTFPDTVASADDELKAYGKLIGKDLSKFSDKDWSGFFGSRLDAAFSEDNLLHYSPFTRKMLTNFANAYRDSSEFKAKQAEIRGRYINSTKTNAENTSHPLWRNNEVEMRAAYKSFSKMKFDAVQSGFELEKLRIQNEIAYQKAVEKHKLGDQKALSEYYGTVAKKYEEQAKGILKKFEYNQVDMLDKWLSGMKDGFWKRGFQITMPYMLGTLGVQGYNTGYGDLLDGVFDKLGKFAGGANNIFKLFK